MASLTLQRARAIVEYAQDEFAEGNSIADSYSPFRSGGATSRSEARNALLIVIAETYQLASKDLFESYARSSHFIAMRLVCDELRDPEDVQRAAIESGKDYEEFVSYLKTLDPFQPDYWPKVYERLGLQAQPTSFIAALKAKLWPFS